MHDTYCCFCSGPLEDARAGWLNVLTNSMRGGDWPPKDGKWVNDPGYPVPTKPIAEIMTMSDEDDETWNDWVCVTPVWSETYVSPFCSVDDYGDVEIEGSEDWNTDDQPYLHIHRICLSFLCRRNAITPRELWESFYSPDSHYGKYAEEMQGLLYCVDYYDMEDRNGQYFGFAIERHEPPEDRPDLPSTTWWDPESMEDTGWILTRPTVLPAPRPLEPSPVKPSAVTERKVFEISELLDMILTAIVDIPEEVIESELRTNRKDKVESDGEDDEEGADDEEGENDEEGEDDEEGKGHEEGEDDKEDEEGEEGEGHEEGEDEEGEDEEGEDEEGEDEEGEDEEGEDEEGEDEEGEDDEDEAPSAVTAAQTLLSLSQVDRWFYHTIIRNRQGVFLQAIRNFGWMLPCTPADWADSNWSIDLTTQTPLSTQTHIDWRGYMITCLQRDDPHLVNRMRFHMMAVQFARGTDRHKSEENPDWFWNVGKLGMKSTLEKPEPEVWELPRKETSNTEGGASLQTCT